MRKTLTPQQAAQKKKRDMAISAVLLVVLAFSFVKNVVLYKPKASGHSGEQSAAFSADDSQVMSEQLVYVTNLRQYDKMRDEQRAVWEKEWGRDPFVRQEFISKVVKAVNLTLNGVLWDEKNPKAIVNEKTLVAGDTIYGYTVMEIRPRSILLRTGEKNIELTIFRPVLSETPSA